MLKQRAVAGFTADNYVLARFLGGSDVFVAQLACCPPGKLNRTGAVIVQGAGTVMTVLPETRGNQHAASHQKEQNTRREDNHQPHQVLNVLENLPHGWLERKHFAARSLKWGFCRRVQRSMRYKFPA
jgi:hypothetical protein